MYVVVLCKPADTNKRTDQILDIQIGYAHLIYIQGDLYHLKHISGNIHTKKNILDQINF